MKRCINPELSYGPYPWKYKKNPWYNTEYEGDVYFENTKSFFTKNFVIFYDPKQGLPDNIEYSKSTISFHNTKIDFKFQIGYYNGIKTFIRKISIYNQTKLPIFIDIKYKEETYSYLSKQEDADQPYLTYNELKKKMDNTKILNIIYSYVMDYPEILTDLTNLRKDGVFLHQQPIRLSFLDPRCLTVDSCNYIEIMRGSVKTPIEFLEAGISTVEFLIIDRYMELITYELDLALCDKIKNLEHAKSCIPTGQAKGRINYLNNMDIRYLDFTPSSYLYITQNTLSYATQYRIENFFEKHFILFYNLEDIDTEQSSKLALGHDAKFDFKLHNGDIYIHNIKHQIYDTKKMQVYMDIKYRKEIALYLEQHKDQPSLAYYELKKKIPDTNILNVIYSYVIQTPEILTDYKALELDNNKLIIEDEAELYD